MTIRKSLQMMDDIAKEHGLSTPYVVGGVPRNAVLPGPFELTDVDITTGDQDVFQIAKLFADNIGKELVKAHDDHVLVTHNDVKYDFSKNFTYPNIDELLAAKGIDSPTDMQREAYSRDFTANTLMFSPDYQKQVDPTGKGRKDIEEKILDCPVDCNVSFQSDPKRMLRAYYFKAKYGFEFSKNVQDALRANQHLLDGINRRYASEMVNKILREQPEMLNEMIETGALQHLPITKFVNKLLIENKRLLDFLQ